MTESPPTAPIEKSPLPGRPRPWVRLILLAVIFISGAIVGAGLTICTGAKDWPGPPKSMEQRRDRLTDRIAEKLELTPDQTEQLRSLIGQRLVLVADIQQRIRPDMQDQARQLREDVDAILTEQQKPAWDELFSRLFDRWFSSRTTTQPATDNAPTQTP